MVSFSFKAALALSMLSGASARIGGYPDTFQELVQSERELGPNNCHTCDCFECDRDATVDNGDGYITIRVKHCKSDSISWMCCVGLDGATGNCELASCSGNQENETPAKCEGVTPEAGLQIRIPSDTKTFKVNTHDGKTAGKDNMDNAVCGGNGNQGGGCSDPTPHCLKEFDVKDDCGWDPETDSPETAAPTADSQPGPEPASPGGPEPASPGGPEPASPGGPEPVSPGGPEPASPGGPEPASPDGPEPASPDGPEPASPGGPEPASPGSPGPPATTDAPTQAPIDAPEPAGPPGSYGDPHVKTWNGGAFDFHGACDLVLIDNPNYRDGLGMRVHIRTKIVSWWSHIATAVMQVGDDRLEISGSSQEGTYYINGVEGSSTMKGQFHFSTANLKVDMKRATKKQLRLRVELLNGAMIGFETYKDFVRVNVKETDPKWNKFTGSLGLMGAHPSGETLGRDGKTLFTDMNAFGQEWQVHGDEPMLFREVNGPQHPQQCQMPETLKPEEKRRRLGDSAITMEQAELACARITAKVDRDACIFDVLATNDKDMAGSY